MDGGRRRFLWPSAAAPSRRTGRNATGLPSSMAPRAGYVCYEHAPPGPRQQAAIAATIRKAMAAPDRYLAALAEETDEHLAIQLGCPPRLVWRLRLAGWPRADQWAAD